MKPYQKMWDELSRKWNEIPTVWLVEGHYPIAYEGGYDWTCFAAPTKESADAYKRALE